MVRLTIGELSALDPRPMREVLRDAVHVGDVAMRELESAVVHGASDADTVSRLLESARYASTLAKIAIDAGVVDPPEPAPPKSLDMLGEIAADAIGYVVDELTIRELPPARGIALRKWALDAVQLYMAALDRGEEPPEKPPKPVLDLPPARPESSYARRATAAPSDGSEIVDAEVVDDDDTDERDDEQLDAELVELRALIYPARR